MPVINDTRRWEYILFTNSFSLSALIINQTLIVQNNEYFFFTMISLIQPRLSLQKIEQTEQTVQTIINIVTLYHCIPTTTTFCICIYSKLAYKGWGDVVLHFLVMVGCILLSLLLFFPNAVTIERHSVSKVETFWVNDNVWLERAGWK